MVELAINDPHAGFSKMTRTAQLAVAISTRDRPAAIARCLQSLRAGSVLPAEVIVVDQSSNFETRSIVEQTWQAETPITYIQQAPLGLAVSQNTAVIRAHCPVVAVIDDDCVADHNWLKMLEQAFAAPEGFGAVTGRVLPLEPEEDRVYPVASRTSTVRMDFSGKTLPWPVGGGNNFAVRREWFDRIGGCDERLGPGSPAQGGMDMDLFYRLLRAGARIRYEPQALVYHERQNKAGRMVRRPMYGHGMGASCAFRLREGDLYAVSMLGHWLLFRTRLLSRALLARQWMAVHEEWLMLGSSFRGLIYGLRRPRQTHRAV
jgi:GT2 family glycosyltransferase